MSKESKKVLIVEDNRYIQKYWQRDLDGKVIVVSAFSLKEAEDKLADNRDISAIVIDACVPGNSLNIVSIKKIRKNFSGPMIAASSVKANRQELLRLGCDYAVAKASVPQKILEILGL